MTLKLIRGLDLYLELDWSIFHSCGIYISSASHPKLWSSSLVGIEKRNEGKVIGMGQRKLPEASQSLKCVLKYQYLEEQCKERLKDNLCCGKSGIWDLRIGATSVTASPNSAIG